ncbi:Long-chain-fatty-acid--CoA ligase, putative [Perkinsus marinus ATCC 50983]|uniref:Long-chain-fatty-acid--CoA ligase, putative n=1 Tax=Perkinsus marinus (strain ATCC 50983 / TXsc) TaxID=423536 RepID=C5LZF2_PERM5|nr:Long-chain-fatty-acid--CoA ligase, putative [Perkinsus marinus ATCC 50983]EEQ97946.1 Long-chain-fatty-acid--CoA ligase, putative [Perkinsus marinus ATCC 50983]|eukprot:XP_002765229.1 Long-chain-fatty-acid--CoA ligase, putative [Perkinsus marinus ATCC 50983]
MSIGVSIAAGVLKFLDILVWIIIGGPIRRLNFKKPEDEDNSEVVGEENGDPIRVMTGKKDFKPVCFWAPGAETCLDLVYSNVENQPDFPALGVREFLGYKDVGERFPVKMFGKTNWTTFSQLGSNLRAMGAYLRSIGNHAQPHTGNTDDCQGACSVIMFEDTCDAWITTAMGAWSQDMFISTVYGTLGPDAVAQSIQESSATTIFCNRKNVGKLIAKKDDMPTLKHIIYTNWNIDPKDCKENLTGFQDSGISVIEYYDALKIGNGIVDKYPMNKCIEDSVAVVMYTSGTTGRPKGVVMPHKSIRFTIATVIPLVIDYFPEHFTHLAYLPLAHIYELAVHVGVLSMGGHIGYADPHTITRAGARPTGALEEFKPHLIMGVPKIFEVIMKGAKAKFANLPQWKREIAAAALDYKYQAMTSGRSTPLFDLILFNKIKAAFGGNVSVVLSGGGALSAEVQRFCLSVFSCPVIQGYGLTETCAGGCISLMEDTRGSNVGPPEPGIEVMLRSCIDDDGEPEVLDKAGLPYLSKDTMDAEGSPCLGRGEVMIRGPSASKCYYKLPELTVKSYLPNGWFKTGDVGEWLPDGTLRIIDRVKNLVKLKGGEYIALENMESIYGGSEYVNALAGGVMVFGDCTMDRPVALVQVNIKRLEKWATDNGIEYKDADDLLSNSAANKEVLRDMTDIHKKSNLSPLEKIVAVTLMCDPWTSDNKCMTATQKISRSGICNRHTEVLEELKKFGRR